MKTYSTRWNKTRGNKGILYHKTHKSIDAVRCTIKPCPMPRHIKTMISVFPTDQFLVLEHKTRGYICGAEISFFADKLHSPVELLDPLQPLPLRSPSVIGSYSSVLRPPLVAVGDPCELESSSFGSCGWLVSACLSASSPPTSVSSVAVPSWP